MGSLKIDLVLLARALVLGSLLLGSAGHSLAQSVMSASSVASINNLKNAAYCGDVSVTPNLITCSTAVGFTGYAAGQAVDVLLANTITGATLININTLGNKSVTFNGTNALTSALGLVAGSTMRLQYDGTRLVLQGLVDLASGTVNSGLITQVAYYPANGTAVSGNAGFTFDPATGIVTIGTTVLDPTEIVTGGMAYPAVTITQSGSAGSTVYTYWVVGIDAQGHRRVIVQTTSLGNASLTGSNYNIVAVAAWTSGGSYVQPVGACDVYRSVGAPLIVSPFTLPTVDGKIGTIGSCTAGGNLHDTGLSGDSAAIPADNSGTLQAIGGGVGNGFQFTFGDSGALSLTTGRPSLSIGGGSLAIGCQGTWAMGALGTAIGCQAQIYAGVTNAVAIGGNNGVTQNNGTSVGEDASVEAASGSAFGQGASVQPGATASIVLGRGATTASPQRFIVGGQTSVVGGITDWYAGSTDTAAQNVVIHGADVSGSNVAGSQLTIAGGQGTGTAAGGKLLLAVAKAGSSGSSLNSLTNAFQIDPATSKIQNLNSFIPYWTESRTAGDEFAQFYNFQTSGGVARSWMASPSDGIIEFHNAAGNNFTRFQFGTTGSTGPAITTTIQANPILFFTDATGGNTAQIRVNSYLSSDGTAGATTTCTILSITAITVKNGLITGCS